jgi:hypothetical protein
MEKPVRLLAIASGLLIIGVVLPFLMVLQLLKSSFPLNFLALACSIAGLTTGFVAIAKCFPRRK